MTSEVLDRPRPDQRLSAQSFFAWLDRQGDARYELDDGKVIQLAPGTTKHQLLIARLIRFLGANLPEKLEIFAEPFVLLPPRDGQDRVFVPDLAISDEITPERVMPLGRPVLVCEVLSPSTGNWDRMVKLYQYQEIRSVETVMLVGCDEPEVQIHVREGERWAVYQAVEGRLAIPPLGAEIDLNSLYRGIV